MQLLFSMPLSPSSWLHIQPPSPHMTVTQSDFRNVISRHAHAHAHAHPQPQPELRSYSGTLQDQNRDKNQANLQEIGREARCKSPKYGETLKTKKAHLGVGSL